MRCKAQRIARKGRRPARGTTRADQTRICRAKGLPNGVVRRFARDPMDAPAAAPTIRTLGDGRPEPWWAAYAGIEGRPTILAQAEGVTVAAAKADSPLEVARHNASKRCWEGTRQPRKKAYSTAAAEKGQRQTGSESATQVALALALASLALALVVRERRGRGRRKKTKPRKVEVHVLFFFKKNSAALCGCRCEHVPRARAKMSTTFMEALALRNAEWEAAYPRSAAHMQGLEECEESMPRIFDDSQIKPEWRSTLLALGGECIRNPRYFRHRAGLLFNKNVTSKAP